MKRGALNQNNELVFPNLASKGVEYKCPECFSKVILKRGRVRKAYFSHYVHLHRCDYYDQTNETEIHLNAKNKLADWLKERRVIRVGWKCPARLNHGGKCGSYHSGMEMIIQIEPEDQVMVEYRDQNNHYIADVVVLSNDLNLNEKKMGEKEKKREKYIFEICHTHPTESSRPEPWFEISAKSILSESNSELSSESNSKSDKFQMTLLTCLRNDISRYCNYCKSLNEGWLINIPEIYFEYSLRFQLGNQLPCLKCRRQDYTPVYYYRYRQICKNCLINSREELKQQYDQIQLPIIKDPSELTKILVEFKTISNCPSWDSTIDNLIQSF